MNTLQQKAHDAVINGQSVFLTGCPGTGKTFCLNNIIKTLQKINTTKIHPFGVTATTGCAAVLINGSTLHSYLKVGLARDTPEELAIIAEKKYRPNCNKLRALKILIIDEISMLNADTFDKISKYLSIIRDNSKPFGGLQVVIVGDFCQLKPVTGKFVFHSETWNELNLKTFLFKQQQRQSDDQVFCDILGRVRHGKITDEDIDILKNCQGDESNNVKYTRLYSLNVDVDDINTKELKKLVNSVKPKLTIYECKSGKGKTDKVKLCVGCQVMVTYNICPEDGIVNGTRAVVLSIIKTGYNIPPMINIQLVDGRIYPITYVDIKDEITGKTECSIMPLRLAWAITIHKSQGATIDYLEIDLGDSVFAAGQAYVGLSRAVSLSRLKVIDISKQAFKIDRDVKKYYRLK